MASTRRIISGSWRLCGCREGESNRHRSGCVTKAGARRPPRRRFAKVGGEGGSRGPPLRYPGGLGSQSLGRKDVGECDVVALGLTRADVHDKAPAIDNAP